MPNSDQVDFDKNFIIIVSFINSHLITFVTILPHVEVVIIVSLLRYYLI